MSTITATDDALLLLAHGTRERAASLRAQADQLPEVLATTYRRRASELELEAFLLEAQADATVTPEDTIVPERHGVHAA